MTHEELDQLAALHAAASAPPWHVMHGNDDVCMSMTLVTRNPTTGRTYDALVEPDPRDVVAVCLLQSPEVAVSDDGRSDENARLIAAMRSAMPELIRLARLGLDASD